MKNYKLTFSAFLLLGSAIILPVKPTSAFVTTDVVEAAGRVTATASDILRMCGINLERGEDEAHNERMGEGTKETKSFIKKITGWATDYAKKRFQTGDPAKQAIYDNAIRIAEVKAEILALELQLTVINKGRDEYYQHIDRLYQEKLAAYEENKQKLLAKSEKLNALAKAEDKIAEYKAKIQSEIEAKLDQELAKVQDKIAKISEKYEQTKKLASVTKEAQDKVIAEVTQSAIDKRANLEIKRQDLQAELAKLQEELILIEPETVYNPTLGSEYYNKMNKLYQEKMSAYEKGKERLKEIDTDLEKVNKKLNEEIPNMKAKAEKDAISAADNALKEFEEKKQELMYGFAAKQAELELYLEEQVTGFITNTLGLEIEGVSIGSVLDGSFVHDLGEDLISAVEDEIAKALDSVMRLKAEFEVRMEAGILNTKEKIADRKDLLKRLEAELKSQGIKFALAKLGINFTDPTAPLTSATQNNFLDKDMIESAENIDEIRRNRFIERRDAYMSTFADAVMLKNRIGSDLDIIEEFAAKSHGMDTLGGVVGADTELKVKTIETLMQYAELLVAQMRMETATEFAALNTYKIKNPDKDIVQFNLDDYMYDCSIELGE